MVKLCEAVNKSFYILKDSVPNPRYEAELLAAYTLKKDRIYLNIHKNDFIDCESLKQLLELSTIRSQGKPFAYITGKKEFMSLEFTVNENVLIPRPETEELVSNIIDMCKNKEVSILDLCTGSGAIAISCAYYIPKSNCTGIDISEKALEVASYNAKSLGVDKKVKFIKSDILNSVLNFDEKFDILVSNPPYIESSEILRLDKTVSQFEPTLALDGGTDGLDFYRKIIKDSHLYLRKGGIIIFEIGYNQGEAVNKLMQEKFSNIEILKDFSGNDRIAKGFLK